MEHANCVAAIGHMEQQGPDANVHKDASDCKCSRKPTQCDLVGYEMHYACLTAEFDHPQKVYSKLNSGGFGQIIVAEEKIQK